MDDLVIDMAPVLRWRRAMKTLERKEQPAAGSVRRRIEVAGQDPVVGAVGYLEPLVASALVLAIEALRAWFLRALKDGKSRRGGVGEGWA